MSPWTISCFHSFLRSDRDCSCSSYLYSLQNSNLITFKTEYYCHMNVRQLTKTSDKIIIKWSSIPKYIFFLLYILFGLVIAFWILPLSTYHLNCFHSITFSFGGSSTSKVQENLLCNCYWLTCVPYHVQTSSATKYKANLTMHRAQMH